MQFENNVVRVGASDLGRGVFACRAICRDEIFGEVDGTLICDPHYSSRYCVDMGGDWSLEPDTPFRFLNHSCGPNCEFFTAPDPAVSGCGMRLWVRAIRDIAAGEELTIDYAWGADSAIPCRCGHPACRGWIVDVAELSKLMGQKPRPKLPVRVRQGKIGRGVFATRRLDPMAVVGEIFGEIVLDDGETNSRYSMDLGEGYVLEPGRPFRFLNHSCDPNCELFQWETDGVADYSKRLWLGTLREIAPGDELTIDYGWPAEIAIPCECGSANCRGWVVDSTELPRLAGAPV